MIKKYLFVPATKERYIKKIDKIKADYFVFDFEDAIELKDRNEAVNNISKLKIKPNYWIRFPFTKSSKEEIISLSKLNIRKFVVPKIQKPTEFEAILQNIEVTKNNKFIVLIEHPNLLINILEFVKEYKTFLTGISLGSHDYSDELNMQHDFENILYARNIILNTAKAFDIMAIDIANMEINNKEKLKTEFVSSVRMGFDGKFFIHPNQIDIFNNTNFFTNDEIQEAIEIIAILDGKTDFPAFQYRGKVFEKPHIKRLRRIVNWINQQ